MEAQRTLQLNNELEQMQKYLMILHLQVMRLSEKLAKDYRRVVRIVPGMKRHCAPTVIINVWLNETMNELFSQFPYCGQTLNLDLKQLS